MHSHHRVLKSKFSRESLPCVTPVSITTTATQNSTESPRLTNKAESSRALSSNYKRLCENQLEEIIWNWDTDSKNKMNSPLRVVFNHHLDYHNAFQFYKPLIQSRLTTHSKVAMPSGCLFGLALFFASPCIALCARLALFEQAPFSLAELINRLSCRLL